MGRRITVAVGVMCAASSATATPHRATPPHKSAPHTSPHIKAVPDPTTMPAYRYGQMSADDCDAELTARRIEFEPVTARGALAPVRLGGPLHGVTFHSDLSASARATSPYELADCRLVLALDDFAAILAAHDIVEVQHYSIYRPPSKSWPDDKIGIQHNGALAIDAATFVTRSGDTLVVDRDFHGAIGAHTCGPDAAPHPVTAAATELRAILCEAVAQHLFNVVLTPNHNRAHHNHFHLEVMAGVTWFLVD